VIAAISREVLRQVDPNLKEAALALGATRWEMVRYALLPPSRPGIIGGIMLGLGRALGETIAVALVLGTSFAVSLHILQPGGNTIAANIANYFGEAGANGRSALIATGLAGISEGATLPGEITGDPVSMSEAELAERGTRRLAQSLGESVSALEASDVLREAMGDPMFEAFLAVRRAEIELFADASPADVVARTRWRW